MNNTLAISEQSLIPDFSLQRWQRWTLWITLWTLPGLAALGFYYLNQVVSAQDISWKFALVSTLPWWYTWALLAPIVLWVARRFPITGSNAIKIIPGVHLPLLLALLLVHSAVSLMLFRVTGIHDTMNTDLLKVHFTSRMHLNAVAYFTIVGFYFGFDYYKKFQAQGREAAQLELQLAQANLRALKMQLNPHFLFNTLNSVSALVRKNENSTAVRMLGRLGQFLRMALESKGVPEITLSQELDFLERYLEIEQIRFGERLKVKMNIDADTQDLFVPNFLLQPIVENAIHHGIAPQSESGTIEIRASIAGEMLKIQIIDDGPGLADSTLTKRGVGLSNTAERLERLYGRNQKLGFFNGPNGGLVVEISIPPMKQPILEN